MTFQYLFWDTIFLGNTDGKWYLVGNDREHTAEWDCCGVIGRIYDKPTAKRSGFSHPSLLWEVSETCLWTLGSCDRASWAKCKEREKTNKMQQSDVHYQLLSQHVSGIIMPILRRTKTVCYCIRCTAMVLLDVVGSGCGALRCRMRTVLCSPEDGHDDALNMLRQKLIINIWLLHLVGFFSLFTLCSWCTVTGT